MRPEARRGSGDTRLSPGWMPQQLCEPCPLRSGLGLDRGCPLGRGGWGTSLLAALACEQHLTPAHPSRLPRPWPPRSPPHPPGHPRTNTRRRPAGPWAWTHLQPPHQARALGTCPPPVPHPGIGPATGGLGQGQGLGQAVPGPQQPGVEHVHPSADAKKGRQGQATHRGSDGGRGPSGTSLARGITDV